MGNNTEGRTFTHAAVSRIVNKAIRDVCRSRPTEHDSFQTICDLHPEQIEHNLIEAVRAALNSKER